ncbi:MAG: hypothetical protein Ta2G_17000 [Termitinemataceae bacterium]|nr:MAG: hypothetical protein Ta2G_17000 [Termitinemataceae bacterium]
MILNRFSFLQKILLVILSLIVLCIITVTVVAGKPKTNSASPEMQNNINADSFGTSGEKIWSGIGRIRLGLDDKDKGEYSVVITPVFPYNSLDTAFSEELAANNKRFRQVTNDCFKNENIKKQNYSEDAVRQYLLSNFNKQLRLGKIQKLFFTEFLFIN